MEDIVNAETGEDIYVTHRSWIDFVQEFLNTISVTGFAKRGLIRAIINI